MGDFSRFQLLQEHLYFFFFNQYIHSHTHWYTKETDGAGQSNSSGQQDFSADWDAWKVSSLWGRQMKMGGKQGKTQVMCGRLSFF